MWASSTVARHASCCQPLRALAGTAILACLRGWFQRHLLRRWPTSIELRPERETHKAGKHSFRASAGPSHMRLTQDVPLATPTNTATRTSRHSGADAPLLQRYYTPLPCRSALRPQLCVSLPSPALGEHARLPAHVPLPPQHTSRITRLPAHPDSRGRDVDGRGRVPLPRSDGRP